VNAVLVQWARKYNVPIIASNDSHYVDQQDSNAHDILLCINTGEKQSTPKADDGDEEGSQKGKRFAFPNDEFFFKTQAQMAATFHDLPEALDNTGLIVDKVETLKLKKDILLPHFQIPEGFADQDEYLKHLTYQGAIKRYYSPTMAEWSSGDGGAAFDSSRMKSAGLGAASIPSIPRSRSAGLRAVHHPHDGLQRLLPHHAGLHQPRPRHRCVDRSGPW
jgi:DNA polymerase III alpha subunit